MTDWKQVCDAAHRQIVSRLAELPLCYERGLAAVTGELCDRIGSPEHQAKPEDERMVDEVALMFCLVATGRLEQAIAIEEPAPQPKKRRARAKGAR